METTNDATQKAFLMMADMTSMLINRIDERVKEGKIQCNIVNLNMELATILMLADENNKVERMNKFIKELDYWLTLSRSV
jgi:hypothetical protein